MLSGEESSSLEETELFESFCCFWAITLAVALALSTSLTVPDETDVLDAAPDALLATSELRRRTTFSLALGVLALELVLLVLAVVVSCELDESLSLLELPESLPLELLSLELESEELPLLDSVLLVDFFLGGILNQKIVARFNSPLNLQTKLKSIGIPKRDDANLTDEQKHQQTRKKHFKTDRKSLKIQPKLRDTQRNTVTTKKLH